MSQTPAWQRADVRDLSVMACGSRGNNQMGAAHVGEGVKKPLCSEVSCKNWRAA